MPIRITRRDESAEDLRRAARSTKNVAQARRLPAIALVLDGHSRTDAATAADLAQRCEVHPNQIYAWKNERGGCGDDGQSCRVDHIPTPAADKGRLGCLLGKTHERAISNQQTGFHGPAHGVHFTRDRRRPRQASQTSRG